MLISTLFTTWTLLGVVLHRWNNNNNNNNNKKKNRNHHQHHDDDNDYIGFNKREAAYKEFPSSKELRDAFLMVYDDLVQFLLEEGREYELPEEHVQYIKRLIDYNVQGGKLNRGLAVADTVLYMKPDATAHELYLARVLGWCLEWLQAFFLVADDIMDASVTRRNQPCWYKLEDVQMIACNDYLILESHIYRMLRRFFRHNENYLELIELMHETTFQTELGQLNDLRSQPLISKQSSGGKLDLNLFDMHTYKRIVKYKTSYYSFYAPIALGLLLVGVKDAETYKMTEDICIQMGEYFQIQDDYLDCYADPQVLGKVGRDIEEGKCCWLIVQALPRVNEQQRQTLEQHYGKDDPESVKQVKMVYEQLNMKQIYLDYEQKTLKELYQSIDQLAANNPYINKQVYTSLLNKIASRSK